MRVLSIESSCDETGVAVYDDQKGLLTNQLYSQIKMHAEYGGVVPELASRDHIRKAVPLVKEALSSSGLTPDDIDAVVYTAGPGLVGALMVGATVARTLAYAWDKPAVPVNHMEGHLLAPMLEENRPEYPFLALLVSGGHTMIVRVNDFASYEIMGESVDDAAGDAFDKTAKLLGIPYPGGALLSALAEKGTKDRFKFPRPMLNHQGYNFSFSGLKTAVSLAIKDFDGELDEQTKADLALAFEDAVVDILKAKCTRALRDTGLNQLVIAGGVSANKHLRSAMKSMMEQLHGKVFYPRTEFCTDNGAMIAYAGMQRFKKGVSASREICVFPRWPLSSIDEMYSSKSV